MPTTLIGVDCAAQHTNFGLALGALDGESVKVSSVLMGSSNVVPSLQKWISESANAGIIAFDAPLGWPATFGHTLTTHRAGAPIHKDSDQLFHRLTDDFVRDKVGKKPLEIGADKIARAAASALKVIDALREGNNGGLPLLWNPGLPSEFGIVEVYPAATLLAHQLSDRGYKGTKSVHRDARRILTARLSQFLTIGCDHELLASSDDALDAVICLLAAADFVRGSVHLPEDRERAVKEGWIWFGPKEKNAKQV